MKNQQHYMPGVIICGVIAGLLTGIPCVNILMCCFCIQIVLPAMFAVKLVVDKAGTSLEAGEAAIIGVIVGGIAVVIGGVMLTITELAFGSQASMQMLAQFMPPEVAAQLQQQMAMQQQAGGMASAIVGRFCCLGVMFPLFGALGGLIGSTVFKKEPPAGGPYGGGGGGYADPSQQPYAQPQAFGQQPPQGFGQQPPGGGFGQT